MSLRGGTDQKEGWATGDHLRAALNPDRSCAPAPGSVAARLVPSLCWLPLLRSWASCPPTAPGPPPVVLLRFKDLPQCLKWTPPVSGPWRPWKIVCLSHSWERCGKNPPYSLQIHQEARWNTGSIATSFPPEESSSLLSIKRPGRPVHGTVALPPISPEMGREKLELDGARENSNQVLWQRILHLSFWINGGQEPHIQERPLFHGLSGTLPKQMDSRLWPRNGRSQRCPRLGSPAPFAASLLGGWVSQSHRERSW